MNRTNIKQKAFLACDPSITGWGWVVMDENKKIYAQGCIKTKPLAKKIQARKGDDNIRRINEVNDVLLSILDKYNILLIISELPHGSQNASAAYWNGAVATLLQTISKCRDIAIEWYSEGDSKTCLLGKTSATKNETISAVNDLYKVKWTYVGYKDEAIADAISIFHVAFKTSSTIKLFKKL